MAKEIDKLVESIKGLMDPIVKQLESIGATQKTIDCFFEGEEILMCQHCDTFNVREVKYKEKENFSDYQCGNCLKIERKYY